MEKTLPKNWVETELDSLFSLAYGKGLSVKELQEDSEYCVYGANGIIGNFDSFNQKESKVIISCRGAASGAIHKTKPKSFVTSNSIVLDSFSDELLLPNYVKYFMISVDKSKVITGTAQPQITIKLLKDLTFKLPPLKEQQRIVAKLDTLFTHLDTLKTRLANIPTLLKHFRQAILTQAVTGKLTEEWRVGKELVNEYTSIESDEFREVNNILPQEWVALAFSSVANIKSNLVNPDSYLDLPYITPDCIEKESGQLIKEQLVENIKPVSDKHFFEAHSIIYSKIRPYLSKLIIANYEGLCSADMYPIKTELKLEYLFYYMLSSQFLCYANTAGTRSVLPKINQKGLSKIPVLVPPKKEQTEIVKRVENLFAKADKIEAQYVQLKEKIDSLPQAILAKAFKGELVPQLPTDGDAKDLLAEIQQLKKALKPTKKTVVREKKNVKS